LGAAGVVWKSRAANQRRGRRGGEAARRVEGQPSVGAAVEGRCRQEVAGVEFGAAVVAVRRHRQHGDRRVAVVVGVVAACGRQGQGGQRVRRSRW